MPTGRTQRTSAPVQGYLAHKMVILWGWVFLMSEMPLQCPVHNHCNCDKTTFTAGPLPLYPRVGAAEHYGCAVLQGLILGCPFGLWVPENGNLTSKAVEVVVPLYSHWFHACVGIWALRKPGYEASKLVAFRACGVQLQRGTRGRPWAVSAKHLQVPPQRCVRESGGPLLK